MKDKLVLLILVMAALPLSFVHATGLTVTSTITDMDYDGTVSVGDLYEHHYSNGVVNGGIASQWQIDTIIADGYDYNSDGKVQVSELDAWAENATQDTWNISLVNPSIYSVIYDLNNNNIINVGDRYEHRNDATGYIDPGYIAQSHLNAVIYGGYDSNSDGNVQVGEFEAMMNGTTDDDWTVILQSTIVMGVTSTVYDKDNDGTVSAGDPYLHVFRSNPYMPGENNRGKATQDMVNAIIALGYDANSDGKVQIGELQTFANNETVHTWSCSLASAPAETDCDVYSFIYDHDEDGVMSVGDPYVHYFRNGWVDKGVAKQSDINWALGWDYNHDGKVQASELEAAAEAITGADWHIEMAPQTIDTTGYWEIEKGNYWALENITISSKLTRFDIHEDKNSHTFLRCSQNATGTYPIFGSPSVVINWYLHWYNDYLVASNAGGNFSGYFDNMPDDGRYVNGELERWIWFVRGQGETTPPYIMLPAALDVWNDSIDIYQTYYTVLDDGGTDVSSARWEISYDWVYVKTDIGYEGRALRARIIETWNLGSNPSTLAEDWYFVEGIGVVKIEQYGNRTRTQFLSAVKLRESYVK